MKFKHNASVSTTDSQEVGHIDRVVLDPETKKVSHVVVRKGRLFPEERVVPIDLVAETTDDHLNLRGGADALDTLPKFEEAQYVRTSETNGTYGNLEYSLAGAPLSSEGQYTRQIKQNIPEGSVALKEGAKVIAEDGKLVGHVEEIQTDTETKKATHIIISQGLLTKELKMIPTFWVREFEENEIYLAAPAEVLDKLKPYHN